MIKQNKCEKDIARYKFEIEKKDKVLSSMNKISTLLTRPISLDKIVPFIVEEASGVFGFTIAALWLFSEDRTMLQFKYHRGYSPHDRNTARTHPFILETDDCIETRVSKTGKMIYINDHSAYDRFTELDVKITERWNIASSLTVPLKVKNHILGFFRVAANEGKLNLAQSDIKLFSTFAYHVSIIIENAMLQEQKKKKLEQLLSLQKLSKKTTSTLDLRKLLQIISISALKITKASHGILLLTDSECEYLKVVSLKGYRGVSKKKCKIRLGEGIVGGVAEKGIPLLVKDVRKEPNYIEISQEVRSELAVPLISEEKVLGVIGVSSTENAAFSQEDLELLMIFASHAAMLIKNARLYEEIITERNFAENILESSPNGFFTVGLDRKISAINPMTENIFNVRRAAILGQQVSEVFEGDITDIVEYALTSESIITDREIIAKRKDGNHIILGVSSSLLRSHTGSVIGVLVIVRDLTELKKTEELIRRMDRLSSLGQLSAGIAHEIRNPLASINFNVQMLSKKLSLDAKSQDIMDDTLTGINRIKRLVKGIHDFAKPGSPLLNRGNINNVIVDSISLLNSQLKKKKIKTYVNLQEEIPPIIFDPLKMQQVFINLIINAMEAMPDGGILKIASMIENDYKNDTDQLVISITDNGTGIPSQHYLKIFDPFFTTKPEGTGLGLSITHKILEQHNALINVESIEKQGTTFTIKYPINTDMKDETSLQSINR